MASDTGRLRRIFGDPALGRLVERLTRRIELGRPLTGSITLSGTDRTERAALAKLLGRRPGTGASVTVSLTDLEAALRRSGVADDLRDAVRALVGDVTERAVVVDAETAARRVLLAVVDRSVHAGQAWFASWRDGLDGGGTLTRLVRQDDRELLERAIDVLDALPVVDALPLPVLAERVTGDTKALSNTPLATLVRGALGERWRRLEGSEPPVEHRDLWASVGVVLDDLASQVLVLNLRVDGRPGSRAATDDSRNAGDAVGNPLARWLGEAADEGLPFRLTLHQLTSYPVAPVGPVLWVCENPAVLRLAASRLGPDCAPLICTEGNASVACHRLVEAAATAGVTIRWRGDFDWTGVRSTTAAIERYRAEPWRMSAADYREAMARGTSEPLRGADAPSPWDPELAEAMRASGRAVMEERLLPDLLTDLATASSRRLKSS